MDVGHELDVLAALLKGKCPRYPLGRNAEDLNNFINIHKNKNIFSQITSIPIDKQVIHYETYPDIPSRYSVGFMTM
jgi:hypothetical protein